MFRRDLIDILKGRPVSLHELALLLDEPEDAFKKRLIELGLTTDTI